MTEFVVAGGLLKNAFLMQIYADVLRMPLSAIATAQGPALGSAIHAAVAAGAYPDVRAAGRAMGGRERTRLPAGHGGGRRLRPRCTPSTRTLHDYFGRGGNEVMHRLHADPQRGLA